MNYFEKLKARKKLMDVFKFGGIYKSHTYDGKERFVYPKIHEISTKNKVFLYVFTLANGISPEKVYKAEWCFKQVFGEHIEIEGKIKKFKLRVYPEGLPKKVSYHYGEWIGRHTLPIVCGRDINNQQVSYDMDEYPHLLLSGETGSGKSSLLRAILTTLILTKSEEELRLVLGDMKRSEFGIYRNIAHVDGVYMSEKTLGPALTKVKKEMEKRGELLDQNEVTHIRELAEPIPYIIVAIDEVALLKSNKKIMGILEDISAIGRSLGVQLILSMQRPDHKLLDGKLKNNLTVRISGRQSNESNARIAGVPGSDDIEIDKKGRMIVMLDRPMMVQSPFLPLKEAKDLIKHLKSDPVIETVPDKEEPFAFNILEE